MWLIPSPYFSTPPIFAKFYFTVKKVLGLAKAAYITSLNGCKWLPALVCLLPLKIYPQYFYVLFTFLIHICKDNCSCSKQIDVKQTNIWMIRALSFELRKGENDCFFPFLKSNPQHLSCFGIHNRWAKRSNWVPSDFIVPPSVWVITNSCHDCACTLRSINHA